MPKSALLLEREGGKEGGINSARARVDGEGRYLCSFRRKTKVPEMPVEKCGKDRNLLKYRYILKCLS